MIELVVFFPSIFVFITISHLIAPPTRLLVLCHPFGTFFVRVCCGSSFSSVFYRYGFCRRAAIGGQYGRRVDRKNYYLCAFWIVRMPSMVFDVIL